MAHKPQSYRLEVKEGKNGTLKKYIVLYEAKNGEPDIIPSDAEQKRIDKYIAEGYEILYETKSRNTVEKMRKTLEKDPEALAKFNELYDIKADEANDIKPGLYQASKYFNEWKKEQKEKEKAK